MTEAITQVGDETIFRTCAWSPPGCHPVGCGLLVHVEDGKVTKIEGDPEHPITRGALCTRCLALKEYIYHPDRIIYPMKRAKEDRGLDKWERITWDEAIDLIVTNAQEVSAKYGNEAIIVFGGTGREGNNYYSTYANCIFGTPNACYAQPGWSCYGPRASITAFMLGGGYPEIDYAQKCAGRYDDPRFTPPKCVVLWGKEPLRSNPDGMFGHSIVEMMQLFGTEVIMVVPRMTWLGTRCKYVLQLRPGTDTAMAMAWLNVMIEEGLYDKEFVENWVYGFDEMREAIKDMTPERAAEICDVPADDIRAAARFYGTSHPSSLCWGLAVDQNPNGVQLGQCLLALIYESFGESPVPFYEPPAYGPEATPGLMKDCPFVLTTGARKQEFFHSEHKQIKSLRSLTPWPLMEINPADAAELGIEEGDWVEMASPYGTCRQRAQITPTIKKGVVHAMHGWAYPEESGEEPSLFGNWKSNINMLMPNSVNGKLGFGDTFKCMICSVKKVDGPGEPPMPTKDNIYVEPSRAAEFSVAQTWRPADAPEYAGKA